MVLGARCGRWSQGVSAFAGAPAGLRSAEILINSVQRSDSSRYGILAQAGTVIHNFEMVLEWVCLCLPCRGYWARFFRMDSPLSSIT